MSRTPILSFDRGTLILHPPPKGKAWIDFAIWDDRIEKFRIPAIYYRSLIKSLQAENVNFINHADEFQSLEFVPSVEMEPYPHQQEALTAWRQAQSQGVVVLPTASGKTYLAQMAMQATSNRTLIVVPTLDLMHQWYAHLKAAFPDLDVGLLGGGSRDKTPILVATYDSATIHAETIGNKYALLVFDECHHLPTDFYRVIAEYSIAPYRLGLTATPDRSDGKHSDLQDLIGPTVYHKTPEQLAGIALAEHKNVQIFVRLSQQEQKCYQEKIKLRNDFLKDNKISLSSLEGWKNFVIVSSRTPVGRRAMLAHRQAKEIALCTDGKLRVLTHLLAQHDQEKTLIFTGDNATVYRISQEFLIPAITHQTPVKERHQILSKFRQGEYKTLVASHVLNEGVDVPDARIAIILSGTASEREYIQRLGRVLRKGSQMNKQAILYEVVTENTAEERTSKRRKGEGKSSLPEPKPQQLELLKYGTKSQPTKRAAEPSRKWGEDSVKPSANEEE
ncbi:DEAD/DEAH box helicase [Limnoraphis robusta]|uniref:DNA 3'-5' helicase n=1 Tax=Limnoraphis robusta CCNP1315 TaxID=3110306 RepID=A0ABU5TYG3_9CYAN|nr:DEAD/DEAH box helicase family protein [Limnoraphis robusta]MEA5518968.1 DEAD/DEAH box helicase family protein [Limnoraphis robusta CCNP1315]MEA5544060.1 DEAD/DEAH box helicase family protein [Limnoraphis robusta CCNP1324]